MISDVPDEQLDSLASGPTMPDSSTVAECYEIVERYELLPLPPVSVRMVLEQKLLEETPKSGAPAFLEARWWPILSCRLTAQNAAAAAEARGFVVEIDNSCDNWDFERAADRSLKRLRSLHRIAAKKVCVISAGEVTVKLSGSGRTGGRNQHFALCCAQKIAGENIAVLSAGTDGIDGNSLAVGAVTDGTTVRRAGIASVNEALRTFDAGTLLARLGHTIVTGPTGNNVRDLRILLAY